MRTLYLDCGMGAAGDMLAAALYELLDDKEAFLDKMNAIGLPGVRFAVEPSVKCGIVGTHFRVTVDGQEEESHDHHHHDHEHHDHEHEHEHHDHDHDHHHNDHDHDHYPGHDHDHDHHHEHEHVHSHSHVHRSMDDITHVIDALPLSETVRRNAIDVYQLIAVAEAQAHGRPV